MARIDDINNMRKARNQNPSPAIQPLVNENPIPNVEQGVGSDSPGRPVSPLKIAGNSVDNAQPISYSNSGIAPTVTSSSQYIDGALRDMTEDEFEKNKDKMNASDKDYWKRQAAMNPMSTYANLRNYFATEETPEEKKKRERREKIGQAISGLGTLIGSAANLYYTSQGAYPVDFATPAKMHDARMQQIQAKRDALQANRDALIANARGNDIRNAYNLQAAREKAAADAMEAEKKNNLELEKLRMNLDANKEKWQADLKEKNRHNRAVEGIGYSKQNENRSKVVDSGISSDGYVYTRNSRLSDNEAIQLANKYLSPDEIKKFERVEMTPTINVETGELENSIKRTIDWDAAAGYVLKGGKVSPEELAARGFIRTNQAGNNLQLQEWGYDTDGLTGQVIRNTGKKKTVSGFGQTNNDNNGKKKVKGF